MAYELPAIQYSFEAGAVSLATKQFHFVKLSAGKVVICSGVTDNPCGILQNNPAAGEMATVMVMGQSKIKSSAALVADAFVGTHSDGTGAPYVHGTDTTKYIVGQVVEPSANVNEYATIAFNCLGTGRAT